MKHILKVANISEVESISTRPLIAMDNEGNLFGEGSPAGPEMVNLGLSVKWAKYNLGATGGSSAVDWYGGYYAWGETETKSNYDWSTYEHCTPDYDRDEGEGSLTKYTGSDGKTVLEAVDDIVTTTYGPGYVMPTVSEVQELISGTDNEWVTNYNGITGLNGRKFMKKSDHSVFIFIPAAGAFEMTSVYGAGSGCHLWSSSLDSDDPNGVRNLYCGSNNVYVDINPRFEGFSVRAVSRA